MTPIASVLENLAQKSVINSTTPATAQDVAKACGVKTAFVTFDGALGLQVAAYFDPENNTIIVNKTLTPAAKNYAIALELGQFLMDPDYVQSKNYRLLPLDLNPITPQQERAGQFAARLLIPAGFVQQSLSLPFKTFAAMVVAPDFVIKERFSSFL